jgi:hypothetical protein
LPSGWRIWEDEGICRIILGSRIPHRVPDKT